MYRTAFDIIAGIKELAFFSPFDKLRDRYIESDFALQEKYHSPSDRSSGTAT
jgi:hypothetical protein